MTTKSVIFGPTTTEKTARLKEYCATRAKREYWKVVMDAPLALVPGHIIRTDDDVERGIALVPRGGGKHGVERQAANAVLLAAAPKLLDACELLLRVCPTRSKIARPAIEFARAAVAEATKEAK